MGEVYRARDTKLGRDVALKLLPGAFAEDAERLARFTREAQVLASLNHPNIASLYGVEEGALVMELIEGSTLAEYAGAAHRSVGEVLSMMRQVAEALEYAHGKGVIHRDLKPANIKVTPEGRVKVLDFGLAKALGGMVAGVGGSSATITISATMPGAIMGTAAYMSPEQARGLTVDKRSDVWSFGVILYELLSGRRAFAENTVQESIAAILKDDPDWTALPTDTPGSIRRLLRRCLLRDRRHRLRDIGDAVIEIDEAAATPEEEAPLTGKPVASKNVFAWTMFAVGLLAAALSALVVWRANRPVDFPMVRLNVDLGPDAVAGTNTTVVISRDGRRLVFPVRGADGKQQLATRLMDEAQPTVLAGTEDAIDPFFSPDGEWLGFFAGGKLKKISVHGGIPVVLCVASNPRGASWGEDHSIIAALNLAGGLSRVPDNGGTPQIITKLRPDEQSHRWPQVLPGGSLVLFTAPKHLIRDDNADIEILSLKTGQVTVVFRGGYFGRYLPSGRLLYMHQGVLFAVKIDLDRLAVLGSPTPLGENPAANPLTGAGQFDFSQASSRPGIFAYLAGPGSAQKWRVDWLEASGKTRPLISTPGVYTIPRFSPDGKKLAFIDVDGTPNVYDLERETTTRIGPGPAGGNIVWAPDGKHIVYAYGGDLFWVRSDAVGSPQRLMEKHFTGAWSFSQGGRWLAYFDVTAETGTDIWVLPLDTTNPESPKPGTPQPFLRTAANELLPRFSPDGRWIAYKSDESGRDEVWVRPFPARTDEQYQISDGGAMYALWSNNMHELFYETLDHRIMVVEYKVDGDVFHPGKPYQWSDRQIFYSGASNIDIAPDGKAFAVLALPQSEPGERTFLHVTMLLNYSDELRRSIP
jgi:serine/threonine-protein kinase